MTSHLPASRPVLLPGATVFTPRPERPRWTTLRWLRASLVALCACAALFFLASEAALAQARSALQTLGRDTAPSIIAAQQIRASLADLDACEANSMLGPAEQRVEALRLAERRRSAAVERLVDAARNITYGDAERAPIVAMLDGLGRYLEKVAQARQWHEAGDEARARRLYRSAADAMRDQLLPAADALDEVNRSHLDEVYRRQRSAGARARGLVVSSGVLLLAGLAALQVFLSLRTRRALHPPLLGAAALTLVGLVTTQASLASSQGALRAACEDAFESIHLLTTARSIAYDANGDESRYLFDRERASLDEAAFHAKIARLTTRPILSSADAQALAGGEVSFEGLFARELANVTYAGEREAAIDMVQSFSGYITIDREIRRRAASGDLAGATALCLERGPHGSNGVFERFDEALGRALAVNERAFRDLINEGDAALRRAAPRVPLLALGIAALIFLGLRPRMREFT